MALRAVPRMSRIAGFPSALLLALLVPALLLSVIAAGTSVLPGDVLATRAIQQGFPSELGWLFLAVNQIGTSENGMLVTLGITVALVLQGQLMPALLVLATMPLRHVSGRLKAIADSPRPTEDLARISEQAGGLGFPSGHVIGATLLYGALLFLAPRVIARRALRLAVQIVAAAMIVLTGVSRVYVGAHWPSDVIGGYLWGAITLILLVAVWRAATERLAQAGAVDKRALEPQGAD